MNIEMRIYPLGAQWGLYVNGTETVLDTRLEAVKMSEKATFAAQMQTQVTAVAQAISTLDELVSVYFDRGYNAGETAIEDADVASLGILAADISSGITLAQQIKNMRDNAAVAQADYGATMSKLRTDV